MAATPKPTPLRTHKSVHYGKGMETAHCGICAHFKPPSACEKVQPPISRVMWCELFKKRSAKKP